MGLSEQSPQRRDLGYSTGVPPERSGLAPASSPPPVPSVGPESPSMPGPGAAPRHRRGCLRAAMLALLVFAAVFGVVLLVVGPRPAAEVDDALISGAVEEPADGAAPHGLAGVWDRARSATLDAVYKVRERAQGVHVGGLIKRVPGAKTMTKRGQEIEEATDAPSPEDDRPAPASATPAAASGQQGVPAPQPGLERNAAQRPSPPATVPPAVDEVTWPKVVVDAVVGTGRAAAARVNGMPLVVGESTPDGICLEAVEGHEAVLTYRGSKRRVGVGVSGIPSRP
jgi:hypothetical protein